MSKFSNGHFAQHSNPAVTDEQSALRLAEAEAAKTNTVVADFIWDEDFKTLLVTFSTDKEDSVFGLPF